MPPDRNFTPDHRASGTPTDAQVKKWDGAVLAFAALHFVCCGLPLLLLSGVSLAFLAPYWPVAAGILALLGGVGFVWYLRRGCATCPRNEGRCSIHPKT